MPPDTPPHSAPPAARPADALVGSTIGGKYHLQALIARGGMGRIYRALQSPIGRTVAVKVLTLAQGQDKDPEFQARFFLEASTLGKLRHPNTVTVLDYGHDAEHDLYFTAMEFVHGRNLADILKEVGRLPVERALRVCHEISRALGEAHDLGIVHRDLKPANIMVHATEDGDQVKVLDFGIAKVLDAGEDTLTRAEMIVGSPRYMAPEQIRHGTVDGRADIYAMGIVLFTLLAGREPFVGSSHVATLTMHLHDAPPALRDRGVDAPASVEAVVARCLAKDPNSRYANIHALKRAFRDILVEIDAHPTGPTPSLRFPAAEAAQPTEVQPAPRRLAPVLAVVAILGLVGLASLAALAVAGAWWSQTPDAAPAEVAVAAPVHHLHLSSVPSGATVYEADVPLGTTPLALPWSPTPGAAERTFELRLVGHETATVNVPPEPGDARREVTLAPVTASPEPVPASPLPAPKPARPKPAPRKRDLDIILER